MENAVCMFVVTEGGGRAGLFEKCTPLVFEKSGDKRRPEFGENSVVDFGFPFSHHPFRPPLQFLPLSDTNQNSAAFHNSAVMSLWEPIRKRVDCRDFKGDVFKRWKRSIIFIKCISVEKQMLRRTTSIRFHVLLCCLIVSNKRQLGRAGLHHFVRKNVASKWGGRREKKRVKDSTCFAHSLFDSFKHKLAIIRIAKCIRDLFIKPFEQRQAFCNTLKESVQGSIVIVFRFTAQGFIPGRNRSNKGSQSPEHSWYPLMFTFACDCFNSTCPSSVFWKPPGFPIILKLVPKVAGGCFVLVLFFFLYSFLKPQINSRFWQFVFEVSLRRSNAKTL